MDAQALAIANGGSAQKNIGGGNGRNTPTLNGENDGEGNIVDMSKGQQNKHVDQITSNQNEAAKRQIQFGNLLDLS